MLPLSVHSRIVQGESPDYFADKTCLNPQKLHLFSSISGQYFDMYAPCGKCLRCRDEARDQWTARMCLHSFHYAHCYFITLTYGSYNLNEYDKHPFKKDWLDTYPVCDTYNKHNRSAWCPSLLCHAHLTKFIKRLRVGLCQTYNKQESDFDLTYCACGEYGSTYGRPHFHLIVWSQLPLQRSDIMQAWSYMCYTLPDRPGDVLAYRGMDRPGARKFRFLIGNIDFVDLVANGTLNWDDNDPDSDKSARHCFNYVAKYVCKSPDWSKLYVALSRLNNAYDKFPTWRPSPEVSLYVAAACQHTPLPNWFPMPGYKSPKTAVHNYLYVSESIRKQALLLPEVSSERPIRYKQVTNNNITYEKVSKSDFRKIFAPFFVCSRKTAIGKHYLLENLERFAAGDYTLPPFCGKTLSFPNYFRKKISNDRYSLCFERTHFENTSLVKDSLPFVRDFYASLRDCPDMRVFAHSIRFGSQNVKYPHEYIEPVILDSKVGVIRYRYEYSSDCFVGWLYDKSAKRYVQYDYMDRISFCDWVLDMIEAESIRFFRELIPSIDIRNSTLKNIMNSPNYRSVVSNFISQRNTMQHIYDIDHQLTTDNN